MVGAGLRSPAAACPRYQPTRLAIEGAGLRVPTCSCSTNLAYPNRELTPSSSGAPVFARCRLLHSRLRLQG